MKCPSCSSQLDLFPVAGIDVQACREGCGGFWVGRLEIKKLPKSRAGSGRELLTLGGVSGVRIFRDVEHICPQCETTLLYRHFFSKRHGLEVDQCSKCGGLWVDFGEGNIIKRRSDSGTESSLENWGQLEGVLKDKLDQMDPTNQDVQESKEQILRLFQFIFPPPGKPRPA